MTPNTTVQLDINLIRRNNKKCLNFKINQIIHGDLKEDFWGFINNVTLFSKCV